MKIGDRVEVVMEFSQSGVQFNIGDTGTIKHISDIEAYTIEWDFKRVGFWACHNRCDNDKGYIIPRGRIKNLRVIAIKKSDLQQGDIVQYRSGEYRKLIREVFTNDNGFFSRLSDYDDKLTHCNTKDMDIVNVFRTDSVSGLARFTPNSNYELIGELNRVVRMSKSEIEQKLGIMEGSLEVVE